MLNKDHPQTPHVFAAARLEEGLRALLVQWKRAGSPSSELAETSTRLIDALHELNMSHFGGASGITQTLESLRSAIIRSDFNASWASFIALAEAPGDNFGTWAI